MKANELMIGDWIYIMCRNKAAKVISIDAGRIGYIGTDIIRPLLNDEWEPIPLTPEILEKNGLTLNLCGEHFPEDKHYVFEISVDGDRIFWTINGHEYDIMCLRFVHQLQHALRLCGIEKEIEL